MGAGRGKSGEGQPAAQPARRALWWTVLRQLAGIAIFVAGVIACYQGALRGIPWLGPLVVAVIVTATIVLSPDPGRLLLMILAVSAFAFMMESSLIGLGVYTPAPTSRWLLPAPLCPLWLFALWVNFAPRLRATLWLMRGRYHRAIFTGALFALLIFHNAERLDVVTLDLGVISLAIMAAAWATFAPVMFILAARMTPADNGFANGAE